MKATQLNSHGILGNLILARFCICAIFQKIVTEYRHLHQRYCLGHSCYKSTGYQRAIGNKAGIVSGVTMKLLLVDAHSHINPSSAKAIVIRSTRTQLFWNQSKPCHICIHRIALSEYSHISIHVTDFQSSFRFNA